MSSFPSSLPHVLERSVLIRATPATVFNFFTDTPRWATWWGAGSTIDARPGGKVTIRYPGNVEVGGEVVELRPPERIVFTYGYASGTPIPVGASRVTIHLEPDPNGTRLHLWHEFAEAAVRDQHVQGWRYQLSLFGNVVANEVNADAASIVDTWFDAWADPDAAKRARAFAGIGGPSVSFRDRNSMIDTLDDLLAHVAASQQYMPGVRLKRAGAVRHCQGTVLADWIATGPDGKEMMKGTNVFQFGPMGKIESVVGIS